MERANEEELPNEASGACSSRVGVGLAFENPEPTLARGDGFADERTECRPPIIEARPPPFIMRKSGVFVAERSWPLESCPRVTLAETSTSAL